MIEECKNPKEYREDGKLFFKSFKRIRISYKVANTYHIHVHIREHGDFLVDYIEGETDVFQKSPTRFFWLSDNARAELEHATYEWENKVQLMRETGFKVSVDDKSHFFISRSNATRFSLLEESVNEDGELFVKSIFDVDARFVSCVMHINGCGQDRESVMASPFFVAFEKGGDRLSCLSLLAQDDLATPDEIAELYEVSGHKILILPKNPLPEVAKDCYELDKMFFVQSDTIDTARLSDSGYKMFHRPNITMKGSTRKVWKLNPCARYGVDASKVDEGAAITFDEYVAIIEKSIIKYKNMEDTMENNKKSQNRVRSIGQYL